MTRQSISQLENAANENDGFALTLLGVLLVNGRQEVEDGVSRIFFAADAKNVMWAKNIKRYLQAFNPWELPIHHHALVDFDTREQLAIYSEEGNMWAMVILGDLLYQGRVVPQDRDSAEELLGRAANMGCLYASELVNEYGLSMVKAMASDTLKKFKNTNNPKYWILK